MRSSLFRDVTRCGLAADRDVSGQPISPIFKGQAALDELITHFIYWLTRDNELWSLSAPTTAIKLYVRVTVHL